MTATGVETIRRALERNDRETARAALGELIRNAPGVRDPAHHLALGAAAEELGEWKWAETAYNLVLRDDPGNPAALERLAELAAEAGDWETAAIRREALAEARPEDVVNLEALHGVYARLGWREQRQRIATILREKGIVVDGRPPAPVGEAAGAEEEGPPSLLERVANPSDADVARFLSLFSGREDLYARQWFNPRKGVSGYAPVEEPMTARVVRQHLFGDITVGVYPIRLDGTVLFMALDIDLTRAAMEWARRGRDEAASVRKALDESVALAAAAARDAGMEPLLEDSGYKGRHLWFFLDRPERLTVAHAVMRALVRSFEERLPAGIAVEAFPRQGRRTGKGYGNLIKLPLGIHRRTGRRAWLLGEDGKPAEDPFRMLREVHRITHGELMAIAERLGETVAVEAGVPPWEDAPAGEPAAPPGIATTPESVPEPEVSAPRPPAWTLSDFETRPAIAHVLANCPVLAEIVRRGVEDRSLTHDEMIVLQQVFGYLPGGVAASNYVLERAVGIGEDRHLKSPLRGNPISCPKIRKRVPHITSKVQCRCEFPEELDHYPTPVLHLRTAPPEAAAAPPPVEEEPLEDLARRFLAQAALVESARRDLAGLERLLAPRLRDAGGALEVDGVALRLEVREGVAHVAWSGPDSGGGEEAS